MRTYRILTVVIFLLAAVGGHESKAQDKSPPIPIKPDMEWKGSVAEVGLMFDAPAPSYIGDAKTLETLWKAWKLGDKVPDVDFKTHLVIVKTTGGSQLRVTAFVDDKGDLKVQGIATRDLQPGFRYVMQSIKKAGIKTVDGKPLKE